ncbi:uncharacterized protein TNCT_450011 [Trichonephila clavata]|uniref:Uncharacterized protein n=1 Tax=Trichonephila clavata TaxID=2740835 RepID=A0A8X6H5R5_TRICU|nr:uncharacterized protein TNCT_450011 [Trichonephila clavata]
MNVKINVPYDAIRALNSETSRKPFRVSEKDLPKTIREQIKLKKHIRKEWRKFRNPFRRKLLKMAHTKYNELIAAHKPGSCHEVIAASLSEDKLSKEAAKGYKITNCRMVPLIGSSEPLLTYAKKSQELINQNLKHRSFLTEADFAKPHSPLYSSPKMHPRKQSVLPKCASNNKSQKERERDRNIKKKEDPCLLLQNSRTSTLHNAEENLRLCTPYSEGEEKLNSVISFELCQLFTEALRNVIGEKEFCYDAGLINHNFNLQTVMNPWCYFNDTSDKDLKEILCYEIAYIYRSSTCISSAVAQHFLNTMNQHSNILKRLLQKKELRIVSMGNGSPSDVIGIIKVLEHTAATFQGHLDVHVSIIGINKKWKKTCITVLQCLERFKDRTMKIDFIPADASDLFSDKIKCAVRSADIVSIVKLFSDLEEYNYSLEFMTSLLQTVLELVQIGALVFVLDYSDMPVIKACGGYSGSVPGCNLLSETLCGLYTLDKSAVEHWLRFRNSIHGFGADMCSIYLDAFSRVWLKVCLTKYSKRFLEHKTCDFERSCEEFRVLCSKLSIECEMFLKEPNEDSFKVFRKSRLTRKKKTKKLRKDVVMAAERVINERQIFLKSIIEARREAEKRKQIYEESLKELLEDFEHKTIICHKS